MTGSGVDNDQFAQFKRDHPEWYYQVPEANSFGEKVTLALFKKPYWNSYFYIKRLNDNFGWRFLLHLVSAYLFIKGFLYSLLASSQLPYLLMFMQVDGKSYQIYGTVASTPWSMKAFMGVLSDIVPIAGYNKRWWILVFSVLGSTCYLLLGFIEFDKEMGTLVAIMFFIGNFQVALVDLLTEGRYAELMVKNPETSSDVVSWVWMSYFGGALIATVVVGKLSGAYETTKEPWYLKAMFLISFPLSLQIVVPLILNWLGETPLPRGARGLQMAKWNRHKKIFTLALIMGFSAMGLAIISLLNNKFWRKSLNEKSIYLGQLPIFLYAILISVFIIFCSFNLLPTAVAKANTYLFISMAAYVQLSVLDVFYIGSADCVPEGPQFDLDYYILWSGIVQSFAGFIGVALFQAWMSEWEFRPCFWVSTFLQAVAGLVDIIMVERWNIKIGISDKVMYMLGYNIIYNVVYMINFMPSVVLISKLCPKGMESTLYALLAGFSNFGQAVSRSIGVYFISAFGVEMTEEGPCNYDKLSLMIAISHIIMPICIAIPMTFILIPRARLTDPVCKEDFHDAFGSDDSDGADGGVVTDSHFGTVGGDKKFDS